VVPPSVNLGAGHLVSCFLYDHGPDGLVQVPLRTEVAQREGDLRMPPHESS
jgi:hypothetical protein